jgi:hypothetical protein
MVAGGRKSGLTEKAWQDLQLPLYRRMVLDQSEFAGQSCEIGYFNLPKATAETGVAIWEPFPGDLAAAADTCARGVIADIRANRFWPPSGRVKNDDFAILFPADAEKCFDPSALPGGAAS